MPLTSTNKVDKQPLRRDAWRTDEVVWWHPVGGSGYRRLGADDSAGLSRQLQDGGANRI